MLPPFNIVSVPVAEVDFSQPIFASLKAEYAGFDEWVERLLLDGGNRQAFLYQEDGIYLAVSLLKNYENTAVGKATKISTFKVEGSAAGRGLGSVLMSAILVAAPCENVYIEVFPKHVELIAFLESLGFTNEPYRSSKGESVLLFGK